MLEKEGLKKGHVSVFIIVAIVLVGLIIAYFVLTSSDNAGVPQNFQPVYNYYLQCIQSNTEEGAKILGSKGGYIENPTFDAGSEYMPFSSELSFLGIGVPYWYYISANGIVKEQVPALTEIENQLNEYIINEMKYCDFSEFEKQGYTIVYDEPSVKTRINSNTIDVEVEQNLILSFGTEYFRKDSHSTKINSALGKFYEFAQKVYSVHNEGMFLENYTVDILRLYAPVDDTELTCSPKIWKVSDIREDLTEAISANIPAIKIKGDYYTLSSEENKYFEVDVGEDANFDVNFFYSPDWPMKMEVWPSEDGLMTADPVGIQENLGMLGFCYVPYHFVYDLAYPVMIQLYAGDEMFQFPVVVYINKNKPREPAITDSVPQVVPELCDHKVRDITISTYNTTLDPVEAKIKFKCFDTSCSLGNTSIEGEDSTLTTKIPQCVNGFLIATAEGYDTKKYLLSDMSESSSFLVLEKNYNLSLEVERGGNLLSDDYAVLNFIKIGDTNTSKTFSYPEQKYITLSPGDYEITAYIYSNSTIRLEGSTTEKCVDVPKSGLLGVVGLTEKKCFDMNIPNQIVSSAVSGGGTQNYYITESELSESSKLIISAKSFGVPNSATELQKNYNSISTNDLEVIFE